MNKLHPTEKHLQRLYYELSLIGARAVGENQPWTYSYTNREDLLVLAAQLSRFDPRLFHILVDFIYHHWQEINPLTLRVFLKTAAAPQCLLVIYNFVAKAKKNSELNHLYNYLMNDIYPVNTQLYFSGLHAPGSKSMAKSVKFGLQEFIDWGFLAFEHPVVYQEQGGRLTLGHTGITARLNMAKKLAQQKGSFGLKDYLEVIQYCVSRQQAVLDLKGCKEFKMNGKGRGCMWSYTRPKS